MPILNFKNKKDIENSTLSIAQLMATWGLKSDEWMIGKQMSFYFQKIITDPKKIARDTNIYVLYRRLPWQCNPKNARLVFPPKGTKFAKQYYQIQSQQQIGIDLMPISDQYLKKSFITEKKLMIGIKNQSINFESIEKFIFRLTILSKYFLKQPVEEIREYYFADKKRYLDRLKYYDIILKKIKTPEIKQKMTWVIKAYQKMMHLAYPEIFEVKKINPNQIFFGKVAYYSKNIIVGKSIRYNPKVAYKSVKDKPIFVFSHFYPSDTRILPYAKAVITEGGGLLSHAAIVCREMKIPCIVGLKEITKAIKNNQNLTINFKKGSVIINK